MENLSEQEIVRRQSLQTMREMKVQRNGTRETPCVLPDD